MLRFCAVFLVTINMSKTKANHACTCAWNSCFEFLVFLSDFPHPSWPWLKHKVEASDMSTNERSVSLLICGEIFPEHIQGRAWDTEHWGRGWSVHTHWYWVPRASVWLTELLVTPHSMAFFRGCLLNYRLSLKKGIFFCPNWLLFKTTLSRSSALLRSWGLFLESPETFRAR